MNDPNYVANVTAAWQALKNMLAPAVLAESNDNATYIRNYVKKFSLDLTNVNDLYTAVQALDDKGLIEWNKPPVAESKKSLTQQQAEFEEKERQRIEQEKKDNAKPFDIAARTKAAQEAEANKKRQDNAKNVLSHLLNSWSVNSNIPGRIDEVRTAEGIKLLSQIKIVRGTETDYVLTLQVIQRLFHCETPQAIAAQKDDAVKAVLAAANGVVDQKAIAAERERKLKEERMYGVGAGANRPVYR